MYMQHNLKCLKAGNLTCINNIESQ